MGGPGSGKTTTCEKVVKLNHNDIEHIEV